MSEITEKTYQKIAQQKIVLSTLPKTWIFDLDGTIVKHNGYKLDGYDSLLPGAKEYLSNIPNEDKIIFLTSLICQWENGLSLMTKNLPVLRWLLH